MIMHNNSQLHENIYILPPRLHAQTDSAVEAGKFLLRWAIIISVVVLVLINVALVIRHIGNWGAGGPVNTSNTVAIKLTSTPEAQPKSTFTATLTSTMTLTATPIGATPTPPPLKSDKYLDNTSLLFADVEKPLSFKGIVPGDTSFQDALAIIRSDSTFSNLQTQDKPPAANWMISSGLICCQMSADAHTQKVNAILIKVAPKMTVKQVIDKFGEPTYTNAVDYTDQEVAVALIYPKTGLVVYVSPGDVSSSVTESSPVVMVLYLDPKYWQKVQDTATLNGWPGFKTYKTFRDATPVVTPHIAANP